MDCPCVGLPNIFKFSQGLVVTFASFVIIIQNKNTPLDLLEDFGSVMVISEFDNILYHVASYGYLGEELHLQAAQIPDKNEEEAETTSTSTNTNTNTSTPEKQRGDGIVFVRFVFNTLYQQCL